MITSADTPPGQEPGRRWLRLASNRLFRDASPPYVYPYFVDVSVEPTPVMVQIGEGDGHSAVGGVFTVSDALGDDWASRFVKAEATWLRPYLLRVLDGGTVTEAELIEHFRRLHGQNPTVVVANH
ncbi:hypothetical protein ACQUSY_12015 [Microbacterium sp. YY-03]|uniref:hypothetical protein n=1 Tax=Microbacterium sp. YY-03 TaxID=3421636 RepID=UPI003D16A267